MVFSILPTAVFAEGKTQTYTKVTAAPKDWSGTYLIVSEGDSLIMDGSLTNLDVEGNKVDVTITEGKITGDYAKYAFTIAPMEGGYSVQSASGKYISGKSGRNKLNSNTSPALNAISFADGKVKIVSNTTTLQYNNAATNGTRFRYYKSENQQPISLYKLEAAPARQSGIIKAEEAGCRVVTTAKGLVDVNLVMTASKQFAEKHPEALETVVRVEREADEWIKANWQEAVAIGAKEHGISLADAEKLAGWSHYYGVLTDADVKGLEADQKFLIENGLMTTPVDVKSIVLPIALGK